MRQFFKQWRIRRFRIAIANVSIRPRKSRNEMTGWARSRIKNALLDRSEWRCEKCGCKINDWHDAELHHIIPISMDPGKATDKGNMMILCKDCHKQIHSNPFAYVRQIAERFPEVAMQYALS